MAMNHEEELEARIRELEMENGELKGRVLVAEKQFEDAKIAVQSYIDEITRIGKSTQELVKNMGVIQEQGMTVRRRLAKVNMTLLAADNLVNAYRKLAGAMPTSVFTSEVLPSENAYTEARKQLETSDVEPEQQHQRGPDVPASDDRS
jgi:chromosome segregation ATPase